MFSNGLNVYIYEDTTAVPVSTAKQDSVLWIVKIYCGHSFAIGNVLDGGYHFPSGGPVRLV